MRVCTVLEIEMTNLNLDIMINNKGDGRKRSGERTKEDGKKESRKKRQS